MVKKGHTLKWLLITDTCKRIYYLSPAFFGSVHDFTIFKEMLGHLDFSNLRVWVDLGFLGIKKQVRFSEIFIPHKASKNHPLTVDQKKANRYISAHRVVVEHSIAGLKRQFILRIKNRMRLSNKLDSFVDLGSNLWNHLIYSRTIVSI